MNEKLTCSVKEMATMLGIGMNAAYELVHQDGFPAIRLGSKILVNANLLQKWLDEHTGMVV